jgi:EAL domain-containing protein (putative c-di-GMP-specific phosphodiesterase class I)
MDLETDPSDAAIATAVIALAHSLGLSVVAEGVETQGQSDFLASHGCDNVQGFFYSRPIAAEEAGEFCRQHNLQGD